MYLITWFQKRRAKKQQQVSTTANNPSSDNNIIFTFPPSPNFTSDESEDNKMKSMDKGLHAINSLLLSVVGQPRSTLETKKSPITDDYQISQNVLGLGINGKVVEIKSKTDGQKYALKVLKDNPKSRREVELHWRSSSCKHIVNIKEVFENTQKGQKCLLVVMEW